MLHISELVEWLTRLNCLLCLGINKPFWNYQYLIFIMCIRSLFLLWFDLIWSIKKGRIFDIHYLLRWSPILHLLLNLYPLGLLSPSLFKFRLSSNLNILRINHQSFLQSRKIDEFAQKICVYEILLNNISLHFPTRRRTFWS